MTLSRVLHLVGDVSSVRPARVFVRETVGALVPDSVLQDALVVVSELITNAVLHAGTDSDLEVRLSGGELEIRVTDTSTRPPVRHVPVGGPSTQGRGLVLLDALSSRWGIERLPDGKTVWVVLQD